jgi:hypothetical protein
MKIRTARFPKLSATIPRFATAEEARRYGRYLSRQADLHILDAEPFETNAAVNAVFPKGARTWTWGEDEV